MTQTQAPASFSRRWRDNFAGLADDIAASPLPTRQLRRSAARQLAKAMAKAALKQPEETGSRTNRAKRRVNVAKGRAEAIAQRRALLKSGSVGKTERPPAPRGRMAAIGASMHAAAAMALLAAGSAR